MDFKEQLRLAKSTKHIHSTWYRETYPEVAELGIDPSIHYLRYGAAMGRDPGKNFNTEFYLEAYPEVAKSGLNPLLYYALYGRAAGHLTRPQKTDPRKQINVIRTKLLSLGFTERPLAELTEIATTSDNAEARALAARELALWHMRAKTDADTRIALDWIARARPDAPDLDFRSKLSTVELLCHYHLNDPAAGLQAYDRAALAGEATPDLTLARVNFEETPEDRVLWINQVLARYGIEPVTLLPDHGQPAYDRLTCAQDLPKITDGPKVTVLIAAYEAAEMLPTALRSLAEQTWTNLEIIVLDDCSPSPDTLRVAQEHAARDPRIQVVRMDQNGGAYVARNHGLDMATGEFVTLHDADDWSHPRKIETQVRFMLDNPEVMGCTSEQARITDDLSFTKWAGSGGAVRINKENVSSFMQRHKPVFEKIGYWDTVRFGADSEKMRRIRDEFGADSVVSLETGSLSFQRNTEGSAVGSDYFGVDGFFYGARLDYFEAHRFYQSQTKCNKYPARRSSTNYAVPNVMRPDRGQLSKHYDVIIGSEFRMHGGSTHSSIEEIICQKRAGLKTGIFQMYRYDYPVNMKSMLPEVRSELDGELCTPISYGEKVTCDLLILRYPPCLYALQKYIPFIEAKEIKVIVNQPPMSDYGPQGEVRYNLEDCVKNIRHYFGKDATWHPIGPLVRAALHDHHADQLHHINLSDDDWHNIIDIKGWDRGPRQRGPKDKLRIGRHARDSSHKWPDSAKEILSAYPASESVEVHVLGGARTAAGIIGHIPENWTVHEFGSMHPRDFLREIDVWIYFANPNWIESFGRTIIEAMAVGVPVILPEIYMPLFKDAVMYATPENAVRKAEQLFANPVSYKKQVEKAQDYARNHFSFEMHVARIQKSGN